MSEYINDHIKRGARINRVSAGEAVRIASKFASAQDKIRRQLSRYSDSNFDADIRASIVSAISKILETSYNNSSREADKIAEEIVRLESDWNVSIISEYTNSTVNLVPFEDAAQISRTTPYQGRTFSQWFRDGGVRSARRVSTTIESGFIEGKSIQDITREVLAISKRSNQDIKTLVRSNLLHASSIARKQIMAANEDLIDGKIWNSTLDVRTTANICGVRDQLEYDNNNNPVGHSLAWGAGPGAIHFNCRSIEIAKLIGVDLGVKRPAISAGENYERGDNTTNRGTVRKPTKANRDKGIFKIEQKTTNYERWLRSQPQDYIADALDSREKAKAFKNGEALINLTSSPLGTPLQISQL